MGCTSDVQFESTELVADNEDTAGIRVDQLCSRISGRSEYSHVSQLLVHQSNANLQRASQDNIRLWNTVEYYEPEESMKKSKSRPPFKIVAGHHGGTISSMGASSYSCRISNAINTDYQLSILLVVSCLQRAGIGVGKEKPTRCY
jgi:hypothetical protein